jgi:hypothetical protein
MTVVGDTTEMYSHDVNLIRRLSTSMAIAALVNAGAIPEREKRKRTLVFC